MEFTIFNRISVKSISLYLFIFLFSSIFSISSYATHFRGGNVSATVSENGFVNVVFESLWRKGAADFPFEGIGKIYLYEETDVDRTRDLFTLAVNIGETTIFRDLSNAAFDIRRQAISFDLASRGLEQGRYVLRWKNCCRIDGLQNAGDRDFSLETSIIFDGTNNGSPVLNSRILNIVGKGLPYSQNLNAFDPDGGALTYEFLVGSGRPVEGPDFNVNGISVDANGQIFISPEDTSKLNSLNLSNPAGDYVYKIKVTDSDGAFSQRDVLLDVVTTENNPPIISALADRVIEVGESILFTVTASDPDVVDQVNLIASGLPDNAIFMQNPGNPASGTFAFTPDVTQIGVFGINFEASDNGRPILTDSDLVSITVLDPDNRCPVLTAIGNQSVNVGEETVIDLTASDADTQDQLTFSASFLPPGAVFNEETNQFVWTPTASDIGLVQGVVFEVRDSATPQCRVREIVSFSVQPFNQFPQIEILGDFTVTENNMITFDVEASDPDGDKVSVSAQNLPLGAVFQNNRFMWAPLIGQKGIYSVDLVATDDGSPSLSANQKIKIIVSPQQEADVRFVGAQDREQVAAELFLELQVVNTDFPVTDIDFYIDGEFINKDSEPPYLLGDSLNNLPQGYDTRGLDDGLHVITATINDNSGQSLSRQIKLIFENSLPPTIETIEGVFNGGVTEGTIDIKVTPNDDQAIDQVKFYIDGELVETIDAPPFILGKTQSAQGVFDLSCSSCIRPGDQNGDLEIVSIDHNGALDRSCSIPVQGAVIATDGSENHSDPLSPSVCNNISPEFGARSLCDQYCFIEDCASSEFLNAPDVTDPLGVSRSFAALMIEDFVGLNSDVQGKLAAGRDITLANYGVADRLSSNPTDYHLVAGRDLSYRNGKVFTGGIAVGRDVTQLEGGVRQGLEAGAQLSTGVQPLNFDAILNDLKQLSGRLADANPNGAIENNFGTLLLKGDCENTVQVFNISAEELGKINGINHKCLPDKKSIIINVTGDALELSSFSMQSLEPYKNYILWNFVSESGNAFEELQLKFIGIEGSILAPGTRINAINGSVNGSVFAKSWWGSESTVQIHHHPFSGGFEFLEGVCLHLRNNYLDIVGGPKLPCELNSCVNTITLQTISDSSNVETFGSSIFLNGPTLFQIDGEQTQGFDTGSLSDGEHELRVVVIDNQGLSASKTVEFTVNNTPREPGDLTIELSVPEQYASSVSRGRLIPVRAVVENMSGSSAEVRFFANGQLVMTDQEAPFTTQIWANDGEQIKIEAVVKEGGLPRQSEPFIINIVDEEVSPEAGFVTDIQFTELSEGGVWINSAMVIEFSEPVDASTLTNIRLILDGEDIPIVMEASDVNGAVVTPEYNLTGNSLYHLIIEGVETEEGGEVFRYVESFETLPEEAFFTGTILNTLLQPLAGVPVNIGDSQTVTEANGTFRLNKLPLGEQHLHIGAVEISGIQYPPLEYIVDISLSLVANKLGQPIYLPGLDIDGGLDIINGVAASDGILRSSRISGMQINLDGVEVQNSDGTPFSGRMTITPVPATRVPMDGLQGFSSTDFVTVQPGGLRLVGGAQITYPNTRLAEPGATVPLSHFDHDLNNWFIYGDATVTDDGMFIVSNPGDGLPQTGWGCSHPPETQTTVKGIIVDEDGNPLHGVRISVSGLSLLTERDGSFSLNDISAGLEGSPLPITIEATAKDINDVIYSKETTKTAVQSGVTDFGDVTITDYAAVVDDRIILHGDFSGDDHELKIRSQYKKDARYIKEVEAVQFVLANLGFRQGGNLGNHGKPLVKDGDYGRSTNKAVNLFQTLELNNGADGKLVLKNVFGKQTLHELNSIVEQTQTRNQLWVNLRSSIRDYYPSGKEIADHYGTPDMAILLKKLGKPIVNDISVPSGGEVIAISGSKIGKLDHKSHQTGIDVDLMNLNATLSSGAKVGTTRFDSAAMEQRFKDAWDTGFVTDIWLTDEEFCKKMYKNRPICSFEYQHTSHSHIRIDPTKVPRGVNGNPVPAPPCIILGVSTGGDEDDITVNDKIVTTVSESLDVNTLNPISVQLKGPAGFIPGIVGSDPAGLVVTFDPSVTLDFDTSYQIIINQNARLANGDLLLEPMIRDIKTEGTSSTRVTSVTPRLDSGPDSLDQYFTLSFNKRINPMTLAGNLLFTNFNTGIDVDYSLKVMDDGRTVIVEPLEALPPVSAFTLDILAGVMGEDGSPVEMGAVGAFTTGLKEGLINIVTSPDSVRFTRADLSPIPFQVVANFEDGSTLDISSVIDAGTRYSSDNNSVIDVDVSGVARPSGNGKALMRVIPFIDGFDVARAIEVDGVFPEIDIINQFSLTEFGPVELTSSESLAFPELAISSMHIEDESGTKISGDTAIGENGLKLRFVPSIPLPSNVSMVLKYVLNITDGLGETYSYERSSMVGTVSRNNGFELGDLTGYDAQGDVRVVEGFGPLKPPEGQHMALLTTSDSAVGGAASRLETLNLKVPRGARSIAFTYNFLTGELDQGPAFNDIYRAYIQFSNGERREIINVDRNELSRFGQASSVDGFSSMSGFSQASAFVNAPEGVTCDLVFEIDINDVGDTSVDSAILIDNIRFR